MSDSCTVIRIPLREVNASIDIDVLVEDQVKKLTNRPISAHGYGGFAAQFREKPLTIILDGFDELLQAKGEEFNSYLEKVRIFQQNQKSMDRPVRVIITSRITLIDKARIPENSTILRLMEFDIKQIKEWIDIWNHTNNNYFSESDVAPFKIHSIYNKKKGGLLELAEQPLLLLMLAIYDSDSNELAHIDNIKKTELYDNLIRRFVRRERSRYVTDFLYKSEREQEAIIDEEMKRLGVVAIGMYNRQDVVILSDQLENDLDFFGARRADGNPNSHSSKESDSVLRGFFFIHKSTAQNINANSDSSVSAFEFLHNTFGEFLVADFILRFTVLEVEEMFVNRENNLFTAIDRKLSNPDSFNAGWFACIMFVPLYSRPVIIEMIKEHASKVLERCDAGIKYDEFIDNLKFIITNQLKMVLCTRNTPSVMRNGVLFDRDIPLVGYLSTYTLNLVIFASVLCPSGFEFDEDEFCSAEANELELKAWDKIALLWRTWFSYEDLAGLSVVLKARRGSDSKVIIKSNDEFKAIQYGHSIDIMLSISSTLADNLLTGLAGLQSQRFTEITKLNEYEIGEMLKMEAPDLYFFYLAKQLRREIDDWSFFDKLEGFVVDFHRINDLIKMTFKDKDLIRANYDTLFSLFEILECTLQRNMIFFQTRLELIEYMFRFLAHFTYDSKIGITPIEILGLRALNSLASNPLLFTYQRNERLDEYVEQSYLLKDRFGEEYERVLLYYRNLNRERKFSINELVFGGPIHASQIDAIENSTIMSKAEKIDRLSIFVKADNMRILIATNLELLSRAILLLLQEEKGRDLVSDYMLQLFYDNCCDQLKILGVDGLSHSTMINTIKIGKIKKNKPFLASITNALIDVLSNLDPNALMVTFFQSPKFVVELIELIPEVFSYAHYGIINLFLHQITKRKLKREKAFEYIRIIRLLTERVKLEEHPKYKIKGEHLRCCEEMFYKLNRIIISCVKDLTLVQLNDFMWFANIVDKQETCNWIKSEISW